MSDNEIIGNFLSSISLTVIIPLIVTVIMQNWGGGFIASLIITLLLMIYTLSISKHNTIILEHIIFIFSAIFLLIFFILFTTINNFTLEKKETYTNIDEINEDEENK